MKRRSMSTIQDPGSGIRNPAGGFTLLELMVAIGVFVLLAVVCVGLLQSGLNTWDAGTSRKDVYERAQAVFSILTRDLLALYTVDVETAEDPVYPLFGDFDAMGQPRIRFVRTEGGLGGSSIQFAPQRRSGRQRAAAGPGNVALPQTWDPPLLEVAYGLDADPAQPILWRAERGYDRAGNQSFFDERIFNRRDFFQASRGEHVDKGVLYWEVRYWTRNTGSWFGQRPRAGFTGRTAGPEFIWDSTRQVNKEFAFFKPLARDLPLDPVYPEMIRITVVLEPQVGERTSTILAAPLDDKSTEIQVASTRTLPPPDLANPTFAKVGKEWVQIRALSGGTLSAARGVRGTKPTVHGAGEPVRAGLTFTTVVSIPMYREGKY